MTKFVRFTTADDKGAVTAAVSGVKARVRVIRNGIRVVVSGDFDRMALAASLNASGFLAAGGSPFSHHTVANGEFVVRHVA